MHHSGRFSATISTRSPGAMPEAGEAAREQLRLVPARAASSTADRRRRACAHRNGRSPPFAADRSNMATRLAPRSGVGIVRSGSPELAQRLAASARRAGAVRAMLEARPQSAHI